MNNPNNQLTVRGTLERVEQLFRKDNGLNYGCTMYVKVKRNYREKDGTVEYDTVPVHWNYQSDNIRKFGNYLKPNDLISISGCLSMRSADIKVMAENIMLDVAAPRKVS